MRLEIRSRDVEIGQELRGSIERRLRFLLGRFGTRVGRVTVYLAELDGPRGGIDKRCRIVVRLVHSGQILVEYADTDLGAALERAADRVGQSVGRELERRRERGDELAARRGQVGR
jgi:putative sigma-54 modulation protein